MSNLLNAANVSGDQGEFIMGKLPTKSGEVSIMTIEEAHKALGESASKFGYGYDPTEGYRSSTYYMHGIASGGGTESTLDNFQTVGLNWCKQLNRPTFRTECWRVANYLVVHYLVSIVMVKIIVSVFITRMIEVLAQRMIITGMVMCQALYMLPLCEQDKGESYE